MAPEKIDNFVPENFQGFLFHYLGVFVPGTSVPLSGRISPKMAPKKWPIWFQENFQRFMSHYLGVYWGRWRPKNGHLVLKGLFSEAAAAALSVEELLEHGRLQLLCFCWRLRRFRLLRPGLRRRRRPHPGLPPPALVVFFLDFAAVAVLILDFAARLRRLLPGLRRVRRLLAGLCRLHVPCLGCLWASDLDWGAKGRDRMALI